MKITEMLKLGAILALFAAAACVMLAFVYTGTFDRIEENKKETLNAAKRDIFPDSVDFIEIEGMTSSDKSVIIENAYRVIDSDGKTLGVAITVSCRGFEKEIETLVGIDTRGFITGIRILEHAETAGLGANAASGNYFVDRAKGITFYGQFAGKKATDPFVINNDVQAITASTITSRAISDSVRVAAVAADEWIEKTMRGITYVRKSTINTEEEIDE